MKKIILFMIIMVMALGINISSVCAEADFNEAEYESAWEGISQKKVFENDLCIKVDGGKSEEITILEITADIGENQNQYLYYNVFIKDGNSVKTQTNLTAIPAYIAIPHTSQEGRGYVKLDFWSSYNEGLRSKILDMNLKRIPTKVPNKDYAVPINLNEEHQIRFDDIGDKAWFKITVPETEKSFRYIYDIKKYEVNDDGKSSFISLVFPEDALSVGNALFSDCVCVRPSTITVDTKKYSGTYYVLMFPQDGFDFANKFSFATDTYLKSEILPLTSGADVSWAKDELEVALLNNLIPEKMLKRDLTKYATRAEVAAIALGLAQKIDKAIEAEADKKMEFSDISDNDYVEEIIKADKIRIISGKDEGECRLYGPDDYITRQDTATIFGRIIVGDKYSGSHEITFADKDFIEDYAKNYVGLMSIKGFIKGTDNNFNPLGNATREEVIAIAQRIYNEYKQ